MSYFLDTNVLLAAVTRDTDRSDLAVELLNQTPDTYTSVLNVMELRSALTKKKRMERDRVEQVPDRTANHFPMYDDVSGRFGRRHGESAPGRDPAGSD